MPRASTIIFLDDVVVVLALAWRDTIPVLENLCQLAVTQDTLQALPDTIEDHSVPQTAPSCVDHALSDHRIASATEARLGKVQKAMYGSFTYNAKHRRTTRHETLKAKGSCPSELNLPHLPAVSCHRMGPPRVVHRRVRRRGKHLPIL